MVMSGVSGRPATHLVVALFLLWAGVQAAGIDEGAGLSPGLGDPTHLLHGTSEQISWRPRAFIYRGLLSQEECQYLINKAEPLLRRSTVIDSATGKSVESNYRNSSDHWFTKGTDPVVTAIDKRVAAFSMLPFDNGEDMLILRYLPTEMYVPHEDWFDADAPANKDHMALGGQRVATVLLYLADVEEGGETVFPQATAGPRDESIKWSPCASEMGVIPPSSKHPVAVRARAGDALLFHNVLPTGEGDHYATHSSCPVIKGIKWTATKWIRARSFGAQQTIKRTPGACEDLNESCVAWASEGECEKNSRYMIGHDNVEGQCLRACGKCKKAQGGTKAF